MSHRVLIGGIKVTPMHQKEHQTTPQSPETSLKEATQKPGGHFWCFNSTKGTTQTSLTPYCCTECSSGGIKVSAPGGGATEQTWVTQHSTKQIGDLHACAEILKIQSSLSSTCPICRDKINKIFWGVLSVYFVQLSSATAINKWVGCAVR